jgi:hypothetical protein
LIHKYLNASNIFVNPCESEQGWVTRKPSNWSEDFGLYDEIWVRIADFESSNCIVGTGFWRAPEVLNAVRDNITPTYSAAVDVYGFWDGVLWVTHWSHSLSRP